MELERIFAIGYFTIGYIFRWAPMATLSSLVEVIAATEGVDRERVAAYARSARESGLIKSTGRGSSAAHMGESDATNLLIAVNGAETAHAAPGAIRRFRELRTNHKHQKQFGRVLDEIIAAAIRSKLVEYLDGLYAFVGTERYERRRRDENFEMRIEFQLNRPLGLIECRVPVTAMPVQLPFYPQKNAAHAAPDQRTTIGRRTIQAVAEIMRR